MPAPPVERRIAAFSVSLRDGSGASPGLTGYASTTGTPYGVTDVFGAFTETIAPGAFRRALASGQDVRLLINHDGLPLARTTSGTLRLSEDQRGLRVDADLDPSDPDVQALLPKLARGDVTEMSFAFSVPDGGEAWDANWTSRTITDVDLFDVSVVTYPANPTTSVGVRASFNTSPKESSMGYNIQADVSPHELRIENRHAKDAPADADAVTMFEQRLSPLTGTGPLSAQLRARRDEAERILGDLRQQATAGRASDARRLGSQIAAGSSLVADLGDAIAMHEETEARQAALAASRVAVGAASTASVTVGNEPDIYRRDLTQRGEVSFVRDWFNAGHGDFEAMQRLNRNNRAVREARALSTSAGAGGQFAPPLWLVEDFVKLARASRVTANLVHGEVLPDGVSSVNLPKIATGTSTAVQATQNTALSQTDATTSAVSSGITTIGGKQVVALQLIRQSGVPIDEAILGDLAADYARTLDQQVISGSGASGQLRGLLSGAGVGSQTYTQASPAVVGAGQFYSQVVQAANAINTNRFLGATHIVMHPRRWAWVLNALDTTNRPLVVPNGPAFNQPAAGDITAAQDAAGVLVGIPVFTDANVPTNLGAGTNQDPVIVMRADDCWLYETPMELQSFDATYADQASVLLRAIGFAAFLPDRYGPSVTVINGTGLVPPTF